MGLAAREQSFDRVLQGFPESDSGSQSRAKGDGKFLEFDAEACVGFQSEWRVSLEQVPDLNEKFASDGCDGDIAIAFAGEKFPAPLTERRIAAAAQDGVGSLDEEVADVAASVSSDAQPDIFAFAALALAGVQADVGDEFLGTVEAPDIANDGQQGKRADDAYAEDFHAAHHLGIGGHLGGNQAIKPFAALFGLRDVGEMLGEDVFLQVGPLCLFEYPLGGGFLVEAVFAQAEAATIEVGFDGVGGGGVVDNGLAVGVEQLAAFAALLVGHPDAGGVACQIDQRDAGGGHFVVVGIGFGVLPDMATLQHTGSQAQIAKAFADLETVAAGFHQNDVLRGQVGGGPLKQGLKGDVFPAADLAGIVGSLPHEDCCSEGVRMAVQADNFSFGRRRWSQIGLHGYTLRGNCIGRVGFAGVCFCHGFSPMARLGVEATSAGSRFGLIHGRKVAVRHSGSCAPRWCFPPRFNHRLEQ
jgi:hypothetical protein